MEVLFSGLLGLLQSPRVCLVWVAMVTESVDLLSQWLLFKLVQASSTTCRRLSIFDEVIRSGTDVSVVVDVVVLVIATARSGIGLVKCALFVGDISDVRILGLEELIWVLLAQQGDEFREDILEKRLLLGDRDFEDLLRGGDVDDGLVILISNKGILYASGTVSSSSSELLLLLGTFFHWNWPGKGLSSEKLKFHLFLSA